MRRKWFLYGLLTTTMLLFALLSRACVIDSYTLTQPTCLYSSDGTLVINASGAAGLTYSIDGGSTFVAGNTFTNLAPGTYFIVVQSPQPCFVSDTVYIAPLSPVSAAGHLSSQNVFVGEDVLFTDLSFGHNTLNIQFGDGADTTGVFSVTHAYNQIGVYNSMFIASDGVCSDTVVFPVIVSGHSSLIVPNVFSPNNDDVNDLFMPQTFGMRFLECTIMNRYGEIVHAWSGTRGFWDGYTFPAGVACSEGTYFYWIKAEGLDGKQYDLNGTITLLR